MEAMHIQSRQLRRPVCGHLRRSRMRDQQAKLTRGLTIGTYGSHVRDHSTAHDYDPGDIQPGDPKFEWFAKLPAAEKERRRKFGKFVKRAMERAMRANSDMGTREFAEHVGISKATIFRWIARDWKSDPSRTKVDRFCAALGITPGIAHRLLAWTDHPEVPAEPDVDADDEDMSAFMRKLKNPRTPSGERAQMREMLRYYATRKPLDPPAS